MRIALDFSSAVVGAGVTYSRNLLLALAQIDQTNHYFVLLPGACDFVDFELPEKFRAVRRAPRSMPLRVAFFQLWLPFWLRKAGVDVLLSPTEYTAVAAPCPVVLGVQGLTPYGGPRPLTPVLRLRARLIRLLARASARKAASVFFVSEAARQMVAPVLNVLLEKSAIIHHGLSPESLYAGGEPFAHLFPGGAPPVPYILCVSDIRSHKDFHSLIRAFAKLIREDNTPLTLLIAGPTKDLVYLRQLNTLLDELKIGDRVRFLGVVPNNQIGFLYSAAALTVYPSRSETFGIPLLEAMACGVPVIASDLPALREVAAEAALHYTPGDSEMLASLLRGILSNASLRAAMIRKGKARAADFSWQKCARQTLELLEAAACGKNPRPVLSRSATPEAGSGGIFD